MSFGNEGRDRVRVFTTFKARQASTEVLAKTPALRPLTFVDDVDSRSDLFCNDVIDHQAKLLIGQVVARRFRWTWQRTDVRRKNLLVASLH